MKIGITGANGFIAWHLRCYLHSLKGEVSEVRLADRVVFAQSETLAKFTQGLDYIVHLAGVNRTNDHELMEGNVTPANQLVAALKACDSTATVLYSSSSHATNPVTVYGQAKKAVTDIIREWADHCGGKFINLIIPHVFGEYGQPFYNSGVATFCHQLVKGERPEVNPNGKLELIHVQDLVSLMVSLLKQGMDGEFKAEGYSIGVPEVVSRLSNLLQTYLDKMQIPDLKDEFDRRLFNTLRSYIPNETRKRMATLHCDNRGWLVETVRAESGGQCFVSSTHPGITRGNHYHRFKVERFFVLQGKAEIRLRKLFTDEVIRYEVDGDHPGFVDMPSLHTHSITNIGNDELITLFWADEFFDPHNPDTFVEEV